MPTSKRHGINLENLNRDRRALGRALADPGLEFARDDCHPWLQLHVADWQLAGIGIGLADDRGKADGGMLEQDFLDGSGIDVVAAADDEVLGAAGDPEKAVFVETAFGAALRNPDLVRALILIEPGGAPNPSAETLAKLRHIPMLFVWGDYINYVPFWGAVTPSVQAMCDALAEAGGNVEWIDLPARGIHGNSHLIMMDNNSDAIAQLVIDWCDPTKATRAWRYYLNGEKRNDAL